MFQNSCCPAALVTPSQLGALPATTRTSTVFGLGAAEGEAAMAAAGCFADASFGCAWLDPTAAEPAAARAAPPELLGHSCTAATNPTAASAPISASDQLAPAFAGVFAPARKAAGRSLTGGGPAAPAISAAAEPASASVKSSRRRCFSGGTSGGGIAPAIGTRDGTAPGTMVGSTERARF